jgi:hypothetical protein
VRFQARTGQVALLGVMILGHHYGLDFAVVLPLVILVGIWAYQVWK